MNDYILYALFVVFATGFLIGSFFLARKIFRSNWDERKTKIFKIELAAFLICIAGFTGSSHAAFNLMWYSI